MMCKQCSFEFVTPLQQFCDGFEDFIKNVGLSNTKKPLQECCKDVTTMLQFSSVGTRVYCYGNCKNIIL